jgi:hypothetical protein
VPQTTPPRKGAERRQKPRLSLTRSLIARYGAQGVVIVDIHDLGARIEHFSPLTRGKSATLVFDWQSTRIEIAASVVACRVHRFAEGRDGGTVYQSGLSFAQPSQDILVALRELMATAISRSVAEQVANLRGLGPVSERNMPVFRPGGMVAAEGVDTSQTTQKRLPIARAHGGYIRCTFLKGRRFEKRWTRSPEAPEEGFTVLATEARDQIDLLCEDYRRTDEETRRLIRLLARITVEDSTA